MATIKLTDIKKVYDNGVTAVHDFNLNIDDQEFIVFVGPSGCGKSTTLRMIAGLEEISGGTLEIDGKVVNDLQPKDRDIAMVFQNYALYPHMTVFENMAFPLRISKQTVTHAFEREALKAKKGYNDKNLADSVAVIKAKQAKLLAKNSDKAKAAAEALEDKIEELTKRNTAVNEMIDREIEASFEAEKAEIARLTEEKKQALIAQGKSDEAMDVVVSDPGHYKKLNNDEVYYSVTNAAEILGITQYLTRKPRALSGGQRQRVAIGRAMVRNSKVFLMDEPLSNLDAKLRNQMRAEIILLRQKINSTFIYVTHDQTEAMTLGDRIVIMKDGFIQQVGTPTNVFDMPRNLFVAEFIGAPKMNTVNAKLNAKAGKYSVSVFNTEIPVEGEKADLLKAFGRDSQDIILGFRPEHVTLAKADTKGAFPITVQVNEMMGSEVHVHAITPTGENIIVRIPTVNLSLEERNTIVAGNKIYVTVEGKVMHFFNPETELSLLVQE